MWTWYNKTMTYSQTFDIPSSLLNKTHPIQNNKYFLPRVTFVFAISIEARYYTENEDVVGAAPVVAAPTTSSFST